MDRARDARFDAARLKLARELHGFTFAELASQVDISKSFLANVEHGVKLPSERVLDALAEALMFEPSFFLRPVRSAVGETDCNFRSRKRTPASLRARARARGTLLTEFIAYVEEQVEGIPEYRVPFVPNVVTEDDAERAAHRCRAELGLGLDGPIHDLVGVLEHCGIVVTRLVGTTDKIDAFSWVKRRGVVVLSADKRSSTRSRTDAAHELGHLAMHPDHATDRAVDDEREKQAFAFARAFLLPRSAFVREFPRRMEWPALFEMKARWGVSVSALVYRARTLDLISAIQYQRAYKFMSKHGWNRSEPHEPPAEEPGMISQAVDLVPARDVLNALGWTPEVFPIVTGVVLPQPPPLAPVVDLARIRQLRSRDQ